MSVGYVTTVGPVVCPGTARGTNACGCVRVSHVRKCVCDPLQWSYVCRVCVRGMPQVLCRVMQYSKRVVRASAGRLAASNVTVESERECAKASAVRVRYAAEVTSKRSRASERANGCG